MAANPNLGRFRILRELGRGAMGVVYLAEDPAIGRFVAVKMINLEALSEPGEARLLRDRLVREARSAGILSHPSIVTIYDIHSTEAGSSIVMEFVEGVTLFDKMHRGRLEKREALSILAQTAAALDYAHSKGVLHRDIKPANLMVNSAGLVKITDFGVARLISQKTATSNMVLGTPCYMSPEQIANKPIGPATDQFALAVVAFELLSGSKPFAADSVSSLLYNIVYQAPASICQLNPALPAAVEAVFRKALAKNPQERYASCSAFVSAIRAACFAQPPGSRRFPKKLAAALLAVLAIAAGASLERSLPDPAGPVAPPMPGRPPAHVDPKQPPVPPRPHLGRVNQPSPEPELFPVAVTTQPAGATVSANGNHCTAPCQLDLPPGSHLVTAELNGFRLAQQLVRVPKQLEAVIPLDRLDAEGPR